SAMNRAPTRQSEIRRGGARQDGEVNSPPHKEKQPAGSQRYKKHGSEESVLRLGGPMILRFKLECKAVAPKCSDDSLVTRRLASAPQACEVVGRGGQRPLDGHLGQASFPEPPHPALFFQDSVHRFDDGFAFA